jgi:hypothetical protein
VRQFFLCFLAGYARLDRNSSSASFGRVSNLRENRRRLRIARQLTMSVESSLAQEQRSITGPNHSRRGECQRTREFHAAVA